MSMDSYPGAVLGINLEAIAANWRLLRDRSAPAECAAVVKANAYGLGAAEVARALAAAGCRVFFVASLAEGVALRAALSPPADASTDDPVPPAVGFNATILVLEGAPRGAEAEFIRHGLIPVLNGLEDVDAWRVFAGLLETRLPAALQVDTGMSRLGLPAGELATLAGRLERLDRFALVLVMSHLACADEPDHPMNQDQRARFEDALAVLPKASASLANSSGIFLGEPYHHDLVRPGAALYGIAPIPGQPNPMQAVVTLRARVLQVREIDTGATVGYGATHCVSGRTRIATVNVGYADGWPRSLSNRGAAWIGGQRVPLVGRVSMDLITFDVTGVPEGDAAPGTWIELIGPHRPVDAVADEAGTIGYEILTSLGARYARVYSANAA
jgi:alanine racemase